MRFTQRSFIGGIMSPTMMGRTDDQKFNQGLKTCENFIVLPQGPVQNRPGFEFVRAAKYDNKATRLYPFAFSSDQTMVLEFGDKYIRFHTQGATLLNGSSPYEVVTPYEADDLNELQIVQSNDVLTLVHPLYQPRELRRYSALDWRLTTVDFSAKLSAPTNVAAIKYTTAESETNPNAYTFYYKVTALTSDKEYESEACAAVSVVANIYNTGTTVKISWAAVSGASYYRIYRAEGGIYSFIGETDLLELIDDNISPDTSVTPPRFDNAFTASNGITSVTITNGGTGYTCYKNGIADTSLGGGVVATSPTWRIIDAHGSGASITLVTDGSLVTGFTITNPGSGYLKPILEITSGSTSTRFNLNTKTVVPTVSVVDTTGNGASLEAIVSSGVVTGVRILSGGSGYTSPTITITGTGSGATATATKGTVNDWPCCASYFEQRRCFASTNLHPQRVWMTRTGTEDGLTYSIPNKDDDRLKFEIASLKRHKIRHIVPMSRLVILTENGEWVISSSDGDALAPSTIVVRNQSSVGSAVVPPVIVNNSLLFVSERGSHIRELAYSQNAGGYTTGDISIRADSLFENMTVTDMCVTRCPVQIVWVLTSDGSLLGLTYVPEQGVGAWHRHTTDGTFESITSVSEGDEDVLYAVIRREINGSSKRYIERMHSRQFAVIDESFFVDCGATLRSATPVTTVTGLSWLEGKTVNVLADGAELPQKVVTSGSITLDSEASIVTIGLPITSEIETLPATAQMRDGSDGNSVRKNVNSVWMRLESSSGIFVGPTDGELTEYKQRKTETPGRAPDPVTGDVTIVIAPKWTQTGAVRVVQSSPLPITIVALSTDITIGS